MKLVISLILTLAVGGIAGWITASDINSWYPHINKPSWTPPNGIFGNAYETGICAVLGSTFAIPGALLRSLFATADATAGASLLTLDHLRIAVDAIESSSREGNQC